MKASETNFQPIIEGTKQYVVPLFQRPYSWTKTNWEMLWDDLMSLCDNEEPRYHFIGSIVTMPTASVPEGVSKFLLIDGQQRLTTIFVLLTLLRDQAKAADMPKIAARIEESMLVNKFDGGNDYFKLLPTQIDRDAFHRIVNAEAPSNDTLLTQCYNFFKREIAKKSADMVQTLTTVVTTRLSVVSIVLDPDDNPHLVFESLNAKGKKLTQADLIRNYFFMRIHPDHQEATYRRYWEPMQVALGDNLTECIRHYMMRDGDYVRQGDVYFILKDRVRSEDIEVELKRIATFARYYQRFIDPAQEPDTQIRTALTRLNQLEMTTSYPFLLNCYDAYTRGQLSLTNFVEILRVLENFIIRRFVCNVPTHGLNKMFPSLYKLAQISNASDLVEGVRIVLQSRDYPRDADFKARLMEARLYAPGERGSKTKLILESIESSYRHKESVAIEQLTIEHVMPQKLTDWWMHHLGEDAEQDHVLMLHTLGNLTLTAYNSELSNASFTEKQRRFAESHLELNKYFAGVTAWNRETIEQRSEVLADRALSIWPFFGSSQAVYRPTSAGTATGKTPKTLILLGQRISVKTWRDVQEKTIRHLAELDPETLERLAKAFPRFINSDPTTLKRNAQLSNGLYMEIHLNARLVYQFCTQAMEYLEFPGDSWIVETED